MLTQRPYIGVVEDKVEFPTSTEMNWALHIKNTGSLPAKFKLHKNEGTVILNGVPIPILSMMSVPVVHDTVIMPGQIVALGGSFKDGDGNSRLTDVLAGKTSIEVQLHFTYEQTGAWCPSTFYYKGSYRFNHLFKHFAPIGGDAN